MNSDPAPAPVGPGRPIDPELRHRRIADILEVATRRFADVGFSQTNIQSIADELQISKGLIYRYFPGKEQLFLSCLEDAVRRLIEAIQSGVDRNKPPLEQLSQAVLSYLQFFDRHSEVVELFLQERVFFRDTKQSTYFAHRQANMEPWRDLLRQLAREKQIQDLPPDHILDHICDLLYGVIFTDRISGRRQPPEQRHAQIMNILFHGLLARPQP
ncbi:MAG: hypothetical protein KatS3mg111_3556 [Pirellulaceae bacterium]|nr:MAG: hypothetical protein KatS3mg111_3556 [Pirellulaceae bacterium]